MDMRGLIAIGAMVLGMISVSGNSMLAAARFSPADMVYRECELLALASSTSSSLEALRGMLDVGVVETLNKVLFKQMLCLFCLQASYGDGATATRGAGVPSFKERFAQLVEYYARPEGASLQLSAAITLDLYNEFCTMRCVANAISGAEHDALSALGWHALEAFDVSSRNRNNTRAMQQVSVAIKNISTGLVLNWVLIAQLINSAICSASFLSGLPDGFDVCEKSGVSETGPVVENFNKFAIPFLQEIATQVQSYSISWEGFLAYLIQRVNKLYYQVNMPIETMAVDIFVQNAAAALRDRILSGITALDMRDLGGGAFVVSPPSSCSRVHPSDSMSPITHYSAASSQAWVTPDPAHLRIAWGVGIPPTVPTAPVVERQKSWWRCW
jgi:hypothetical protein